MDALKSFFKYARVTLSYSVALDPGICGSCETCYEVCPVGCFCRSGGGGEIELCCPELCIACGACQLQCPCRAARLLPQEA